MVFSLANIPNVEPSEAWAAGLFEGEGSIVRRTDTGWTVSLGSTDYDVILAFARVAGVGKVYGPYDPPSRRVDGGPCLPYWRWSVHDKNGILKFARRFQRYLGERRAARLTECAEAVARTRQTRTVHTRRVRSEKVVWIGEEYDWAEDVLAAYERLGTIDAACAEVGISRTQVYDRRRHDKDFDERFRALMPAKRRRRVN